MDYRLALNPTCYLNNTTPQLQLRSSRSSSPINCSATMDDKVKYLLSLSAVRERAKIVGEAAEAGKLSHFDVHEERLGEAADFVTSVIKVCWRNRDSIFTTITDSSS
jgi:hypothetical protein